MSITYRILVAGMMLAGTLCFSLMNSLAKLTALPVGSSQGLSAVQITCARYIIAMLVILPFIKFHKRWYLVNSIRPYVARTVAGLGGIFFMFTAVQTLPISVASALGLMAPVFAMVLSIVLLSERVAVGHWIVLGIGLTGVWMVLQPSSGVNLLGVVFGLAAAACLGLELVLLRYLASGQDRNITVLFVSNLIGSVLSLLALVVIADLHLPTPTQMLQLLAIGMFAITGQALYLDASSRAPAHFLAPFLLSSILYGVAIDVIWFDEILTSSMIMGILAILICGALMLRLRQAL